MTEKVYIQITDGDGGVVLTLPPEEAKTIIDEMVSASEDGNESEYHFKTAHMTETDFKNLPYFEGF